MIKNNLEQPMLSYYVIYLEKFSKTMEALVTRYLNGNRIIINAPFTPGGDRIIAKVATKCKIFWGAGD